MIFVTVVWDPGDNSLKAQMMISIFSKHVFLNEGYVHCFFRHDALAYLIDDRVV